MLFRRQTLEAIVSGEVSLAFRRWKRPTVKAGGRVRTASGVVLIGGITTVDGSALTEKDAVAAGFPTRAALREMLGPDDGTPAYRIELNGIEPDGRVALRNDAVLSDEDWHALTMRFARWDKTSPGYFPSILRAIDANPEVVAAALAARAGVETLKFKQDVRKLKELGLTESLDVGYRLSPRGEAVLEKLREHRL
ncbi:ASCH domain-containing protein [Mesorhizobium sp. PAMC28654]|uniref:ASCH domain-containing protein n=1 Tax=Mesorhizobium sp. PAMC28654 TaxID=2880934 RepID=UPI001D0B3C38|nr:ASCH domain-containing protein [Mesorhizobium sp. PAMC28654]UDL92098.1 ASCH domain-containing protein [Mesorhizobium sp. PAMC28654]